MTKPDTSMGSACQQANHPDDPSNPRGNCYKKPPLGIMPRKLHEKIRAMELLGAIRRYNEAGLMYKLEWIDEVIDYVERN